MTLREQGYRFYVSPDRQRVKWLQPAMRDHMYADWVDVTDWPDDDLVAHLEAA